MRKRLYIFFVLAFPLSLVACLPKLADHKRKEYQLRLDQCSAYMSRLKCLSLRLNRLKKEKPQSMGNILRTEQLLKSHILIMEPAILKLRKQKNELKSLNLIHKDFIAQTERSIAYYKKGRDMLKVAYRMHRKNRVF